MRINSQELLVANNKRMKMSALNNQTAPVVEPQESKPDSTLNALNLQGQNNLAFQGSMLRGAKKMAFATMLAILAATSVMTTSCVEMEQESYTYIDESLIQKLIDAQNKANEEQKEILTLILTELQKGNQISSQNQQLLFQILAANQQLDKNDKEGLALINKMLSVLYDFMSQNKQMDKETHALLQVIIANQQKFSAEQKEMLLTLIGKVDSLDKNVVEAFTTLFGKLDNISEEGKTIATQILKAIIANNNISAANANMLSILVKQVAQLDKNDKAGMELIGKIWAEVQKYLEENKEMDKKELFMLQSILENIQNFNADTKELLLTVINKFDSLGADAKAILDKIYSALDKNNVISSQNQELLGQVVARLVILDKNDKEGFDLLNKIWAQLQKSIEYNEALEGKTHALLHAILESIQNLSDNEKASLDKILDAINKNSEIAQGTQELVKELLGKVDKLGDKADKIIETIANIGVGEKVDLSKIEAMLADLLAQEKANGQIFNNLDSKLGLIEVTLEALKKHEMANDPEVLKKLQEILDKIPAGCDCTHETLDISVIVDKLQQIIDKMGDDKNEGILGDLGNLDNILG